MPGAGLVLCVLAPFALLGLLVMVQLRVALADSAFRLLAPSWRDPGTPRFWSAAGVAAGNLLVPLLASFFGMAALASGLGLPPVAGYVLHGLNVAQGLLGLALVARLLFQPDLR